MSRQNYYEARTKLLLEKAKAQEAKAIAAQEKAAAKKAKAEYYQARTEYYIQKAESKRLKTSHDHQGDSGQDTPGSLPEPMQASEEFVAKSLLEVDNSIVDVLPQAADEQQNTGFDAKDNDLSLLALAEGPAGFFDNDDDQYLSPLPAHLAPQPLVEAPPQPVDLQPLAPLEEGFVNPPKDVAIEAKDKGLSRDRKIVKLAPPKKLGTAPISEEVVLLLKEFFKGSKITEEVIRDFRGSGSITKERFQKLSRLFTVRNINNITTHHLPTIDVIAKNIDELISISSPLNEHVTIADIESNDKSCGPYLNLASIFGYSSSRIDEAVSGLLQSRDTLVRLLSDPELIAIKFGIKHISSILARSGAEVATAIKGLDESAPRLKALLSPNALGYPGGFNSDNLASILRASGNDVAIAITNLTESIDDLKRLVSIGFTPDEIATTLSVSKTNIRHKISAIFKIYEEQFLPRYGNKNGKLFALAIMRIGFSRDVSKLPESAEKMEVLLNRFSEYQITAALLSITTLIIDSDNLSGFTLNEVKKLFSFTKESFNKNSAALQKPIEEVFGVTAEGSLFFPPIPKARRSTPLKIISDFDTVVKKIKIDLRNAYRRKPAFSKMVGSNLDEELAGSDLGPSEGGAGPAEHYEQEPLNLMLEEDLYQQAGFFDNDDGYDQYLTPLATHLTPQPLVEALPRPVDLPPLPPPPADLPDAMEEFAGPSAADAPEELYADPALSGDINLGNPLEEGFVNPMGADIVDGDIAIKKRAKRLPGSRKIAPLDGLGEIPISEEVVLLLKEFFKGSEATEKVIREFRGSGSITKERFQKLEQLFSMSSVNNISDTHARNHLLVLDVIANNIDELISISSPLDEHVTIEDIKSEVRGHGPYFLNLRLILMTSGSRINEAVSGLLHSRDALVRLLRNPDLIEIQFGIQHISLILERSGAGVATAVKDLDESATRLKVLLSPDALGYPGGFNAKNLTSILQASGRNVGIAIQNLTESVDDLKRLVSIGFTPDQVATVLIRSRQDIKQKIDAIFKIYEEQFLPRYGNKNGKLFALVMMRIGTKDDTAPPSFLTAAQLMETLLTRFSKYEITAALSSFTAVTIGGNGNISAFSQDGLQELIDFTKKSFEKHSAELKKPIKEVFGGKTEESLFFPPAKHAHSCLEEKSGFDIMVEKIKKDLKEGYKKRSASSKRARSGANAGPAEGDAGPAEEGRPESLNLAEVDDGPELPPKSRPKKPTAKKTSARRVTKASSK